VDVRGVWLVVALAGCGRIGFDVDSDALSRPDADLARVCGPAYQPVAGLTSRYRVFSSPRNWFMAEAECESDGGHLAIPDDAAEAAWLDAQTAGWVGVSDHTTEGTFLEVTGGAPGFTLFDMDEPNNATNSEDCVEVRSNQLWNDTGCGVSREFVCECDGVQMPSPPVWCDTTLSSSCGECGTACTGGDTCNSQVCSDPS